MKKIGLVGGLTWYPTVEYYKNINQFVNQNLSFLSSSATGHFTLDIEVLNEKSIGYWR